MAIEWPIFWRNHSAHGNVYWCFPTKYISLWLLWYVHMAVTGQSAMKTFDKTDERFAFTSISLCIYPFDILPPQWTIQRNYSQPWSLLSPRSPYVLANNNFGAETINFSIIKMSKIFFICIYYFTIGHTSLIHNIRTDRSANEPLQWWWWWWRGRWWWKDNETDHRLDGKTTMRGRVAVFCNCLCFMIIIMNFLHNS